MSSESSADRSASSALSFSKVEEENKTDWLLNTPHKHRFALKQIALKQTEQGNHARDPVSDREADASAPPKCLNCKTPLRGTYCHRCGQSADTQRLSFGRVAAGLMRGLVDLDSKTLRTLRDLMRCPGAMILNYLKGQRTPYLGPLRYYVLSVATSIGFTAVLGITDIARAGANNGDMFLGGSFIAFQVVLLYALFMLPLAGAQWYLHREGPWKIAEHYVFLLYLLAQSILVLAFFDGVLFMLTGSELYGEIEGAAGLAVLVMYILWAGPQFYGEAVWHVAWKTVVALALSLLGMVVALLLFVGSYSLIRLLLAI